MLAEAGVAQAGLDEGLISYKWAVARRLQSRQKYEPTQVYQSKLCANDPGNFNALKFGKIEAQTAALARALSRPGTGILRYNLVIVLLWIGGMKFTAYEAAGIAPLAVHSPFMHWLYLFLGERNFSNLLGIVEIALGLGIALRQLVPLVSGFASLLCVGVFLTTLTFLFTTPGWESTLGGFPALSAPVGQFLLKDIVLLGAAVFTASEAFAAVSAPEMGSE